MVPVDQAPGWVRGTQAVSGGMGGLGLRGESLNPGQSQKQVNPRICLFLCA